MKQTRPVILSGFSSQDLSRDIASHFDARLFGVKTKVFDDREIRVTIEDNVRGREAVIVASGSGDPNRNEKETRMLLRAARDHGAKLITLVLPYMTYGRSDGDFDERSTAGLIDTIETYRPFCDNVIVADPHNHGLTKQTFRANPNIKSVTTAHFAYPFAVQLNELFTQNVISRENLLLTYPDAGASKRITRSFREALYRTAAIDLNPKKSDEWAQALASRDTETGHKDISVSTNVEGKDIVIFEDMIASGGTACDIAKLLKDKGAKSVVLFATSGLFTPKRGQKKTSVIEKINNSHLDAVFITDTYNYRHTHPSISRAIEKSPIIHIIQTGKMLAELVNAVHMQVTGDMHEDANSISAILTGRHPSQRNGSKIVQPTALKNGSPLLAP